MRLPLPAISLSLLASLSLTLACTPPPPGEDGGTDEVDAGEEGATDGGPGPTDSGPDPTDGGPTGGATAEEIAALVEAFGTYWESCADEAYGFLVELEPTYIEAVGLSAEDMEAGMSASLANLAESDRYVFRPSAYASCLAFLTDTSACASVLDDDSAFVEAECDLVFEGTQEVGEACASGECVRTASCQITGEAGECGTCVPRAGLGESCDDADCERGLRCNFEQSPPVCVAPEPAEEGFAENDPCDPEGMQCGSPYATGLVCITPEEGEPRCEAIIVVEEGGECDYPGLPGALRYCANGLLSTHHCDADLLAGESTGTCVIRPANGEDCDGLNPCNLVESYCHPVEETCAPAADEGESCVETRCRLGLVCDGESSTCRSSMSVDEPAICPAP